MLLCYDIRDTRIVQLGFLHAGVHLLGGIENTVVLCDQGKSEPHFRVWLLLVQCIHGPKREAESSVDTSSLRNEQSLIATFVKRNKRNRYQEILSNLKAIAKDNKIDTPTHKFINQLAHFKDFDPKYRPPFPSSKLFVDNIAIELQKRHSPNVVYAISEDPALDQKVLPLLEALKQTVGRGYGHRSLLHSRTSPLSWKQKTSVLSSSRTDWNYSGSTRRLSSLPFGPSLGLIQPACPFLASNWALLEQMARTSSDKRASSLPRPQN